MTLPTINIKGTNIELTDELEELVEKKLAAIEKFMPKDESDVKCDVELEKINEQQSGMVYRAEVNLYIGGVKHRAEALEDQIEKAIDKVRDEVAKEVRRVRGKKGSLIKRGGQKIKDMMRFGE